MTAFEQVAQLELRCWKLDGRHMRLRLREAHGNGAPDVRAREQAAEVQAQMNALVGELEPVLPTLLQELMAELEIDTLELHVSFGDSFREAAVRVSSVDTRHGHRHVADVQAQLDRLPGWTWARLLGASPLFGSTVTVTRTGVRRDDDVV